MSGQHDIKSGLLWDGGGAYDDSGIVSGVLFYVRIGWLVGWLVGRQCAFSMGCGTVYRVLDGICMCVMTVYG